MEALKAKGVTIDETAEIIENEELVPQLDGYTDDDTYIQFKFNILHNNTKYESTITLYITSW